MRSIERYKRELSQMFFAVVIGCLLFTGSFALVSDSCGEHYDNCNFSEFILSSLGTIFLLLTAIMAIALVIYFFAFGFSLQRQSTKVFQILYWFLLAIVIMSVGLLLYFEYCTKQTEIVKYKAEPLELLTKPGPTLLPDPIFPTE